MRGARATPWLDAPPYGLVAELRRRSRRHPSFARSAWLRPLARGRLRRLRRAVSVFGFHLAAVDLRQNSDVHERVVAELFSAARPDIDYLSLDEPARIKLLAEELRTRPPAGLALPQVLRRNHRRTRDHAHRRRDAPALRRRLHPELHHLEERRRIRHTRGRAAGQGSRAAASARRRGSPSTSFRCSKPSATCATPAR